MGKCACPSNVVRLVEYRGTLTTSNLQLNETLVVFRVLDRKPVKSMEVNTLM